jgi:hypothetical protein
MTPQELIKSVVIIFLLVIGINFMINKILSSFSSSNIKKEDEDCEKR